MRWVIAALVVLGLTVGIVLLWPSDEPEDPPVAEVTTTTSTLDPTTSTTEPVESTTSTTVDDGSHVVETVEEAEAILRELWFGWFEGIYDQDEERIREVVVLEETVETARESFGVMEFSQAPAPELIMLSETEILSSDEECLAVWAQLSVEGFRPGAVGSSGVYVVRWQGDKWRLLSVWTNRNDLWEADCESLL